MTRPLQTLNLRLLPSVDCADGRHDGKPDQGTFTAGGTWWRCRRCPHAWHIDVLGRLTGRRATDVTG